MIRQIPMLFNAAMIQALLDGRKTETRRIFWARKDLPPPHTITVTEGDYILRWHSGLRHDYKPRTQVGDLIWVKENYRIGAWRTEQWARGNGECDGDVAVDYTADGYARKEWLNSGNPDMMLRLINQSRDDAEKSCRLNPNAEFQYRWSPGESPCRIRPSIHMPKAFSRLTLRVTSFDIERLHDIDDAGAIAEGIYETYPGLWDHSKNQTAFKDPINAYRDLWNHINGPDAWTENPWVTVTRYEVLRQNVERVSA